jgi:hypothetical protein
MQRSIYLVVVVALGFSPASSAPLGQILADRKRLSRSKKLRLKKAPRKLGASFSYAVRDATHIYPCRFRVGELCNHGLCAPRNSRAKKVDPRYAQPAWFALCCVQRETILQSLGHPPFILEKKEYPCPVSQKECVSFPLRAFRGSGPKRVMVREHPCLFHRGKLCHHLLCARKAHRNDYECPCPAGQEPIPKWYGPSRIVKSAVETVREHPCQIHPGRFCHHVSCSWEAHRIGYQCQHS